jgi:hypothetical protein
VIVGSSVASSVAWLGQNMVDDLTVAVKTFPKEGPTVKVN